MTDISAFRGSFVPRQPSIDDYELSEQATAVPDTQRVAPLMHNSDVAIPQMGSDSEEETTSNRRSNSQQNTPYHRDPEDFDYEFQDEEEEYDADQPQTVQNPRNREKEDEDFSTSSAVRKRVQNSQIASHPNKAAQNPSSHTKKNANGKKKSCFFCGTTETPMWRRGPEGKGTLCNACGVKWSLKFRKAANANGNKQQVVRKQTKKVSKQQQQQQDKNFAAVSSSAANKNNNREQTQTSPNSSNPTSPSRVSTGPRKRSREDEISPVSSSFPTVPSSITAETSKRIRVGESANSASLKSSVDYFNRDSSNNNSNINSANSPADSSTGNGLYFNPDHHDLLARLVRVVEDQLVEVEELEHIKTDVNRLTTEAASKTHVVKKELQESQQLIAAEFSTIRQEMNDFVTQRQAQFQAELNQLAQRKLMELQSHSKSFRQGVYNSNNNNNNNNNVISNNNNGSGNFPLNNAVINNMTVAAVESRLEEIQQNVENSSRVMKATIDMDLANSLHTLKKQMDTEETKINLGFRDIQKKSSEVNQQIESLGKVFAAQQTSSHPQQTTQVHPQQPAQQQQTSQHQ